ncbi:MAG: endonuclease III [Armatimonadetes bacterium]|nr:endonuclease III [Armatimonadota bacterium]MCX7968782.1 endonuclease III [Armatimonadota bacterium]MDW8144090.1 endonuclease III [Armatimonadota bacterium]
MKQEFKGAAAIKQIRKGLKKAYPNATTELNWRTPFELLIATVLSAQTTDKKVNEVTPKLFEKYPDAFALSQAKLTEVESIVRPLGYFRQKARTIVNIAKKLVEQYEGEVPKSMDEMLQLPGVGRKTAAIVLGTAFGVQEGIAVDTHVQRVSQRLGLTGNKQPEKIEKDLMALVPRNEWSWFGHALTLHGRYVCVAKKPQCSTCVLEKYCEKVGVTQSDKGSSLFH